MSEEFLIIGDDFVIVVRVEVACGLGVSCRCKVLVKCDINKVVFLFCIIVLGHKVHACVQVESYLFFDGKYSNDGPCILTYFHFLKLWMKNIQ